MGKLKTMVFFFICWALIQRKRARSLGNVRLWIFSWPITVLNLSLFCSKCPWDCTFLFQGFLCECKQAWGGDYRANRALSEFPSHGIMQTRAGYKMVPSYDLGDLGLICKYCSFKGFLVKICLLQWSQWDCSGSHQMTIWFKIRMRVWSRICYLLNFYIFFPKNVKSPKALLSYSISVYVKLEPFVAGVSKPWKCWKEIEHNVLLQLMFCFTQLSP